MIEYTVVDPDAPTIRAAKSASAPWPELHFFEGTASDYLYELYANRSSYLSLLRQRQELLAKWNERREDFVRYVGMLQKRFVYPAQPSDEEWLETLEVFENDFALDMAAVDPRNPDALFELLSKKGANSVWERFYDQALVKTAFDLKNTELIVTEGPPRFDIVINSWMPSGVDFTTDIRMANASYIVYALDNYGATGLREESLPEYNHQIGEGESYRPGSGYRGEVQWDGPSTPELRDRQPGTSFMGTVACNGIRIQRRSDVPAVLEALLDTSELDMGKSYPWEKDLYQEYGRHAESPVGYRDW